MILSLREQDRLFNLICVNRRRKNDTQANIHYLKNAKVREKINRMRKRINRSFKNYEIIFLYIWKSYWNEWVFRENFNIQLTQKSRTRDGSKTIEVLDELIASKKSHLVSFVLKKLFQGTNNSHIV